MKTREGRMTNDTGKSSQSSSPDGLLRTDRRTFPLLGSKMEFPMSFQSIVHSISFHVPLSNKESDNTSPLLVHQEGNGGWEDDRTIRLIFQYVHLSLFQRETFCLLLSGKHTMIRQEKDTFSLSISLSPFVVSHSFHSNKKWRGKSRVYDHKGCSSIWKKEGENPSSLTP